MPYLLGWYGKRVRGGGGCGGTWGNGVGIPQYTKTDPKVIEPQHCQVKHLHAILLSINIGKYNRHSEFRCVSIVC